MKKPKRSTQSDRRSFIRHSGLLGATGMLAPHLLAAAGQDYFLPHKQRQPAQDQKKLGIALVGLGRYSEGQLAPALEETQFCRLAGIVTGTPDKEEKWMKKYDIPEKNVYNYDNFDSIADNPDIDIVYVVLPNSMHAEYTIRAAKAGKHVICEKPMATSVEDAQAMIDACQENNVMLSIGYRLHFEPHHLRVMELGQEQVYGPVKAIEANNNMTVKEWEWRLDNALAGGGPLMDLGIYTVQGACYTMGQWPTEVVKASYGDVTKPDLFKSVEESISFTLRFPNGAESTHTTSYNDKGSLLKATAENGWWELSPSYGYDGIKGETSEGKMDLKNVNQQARQMDYFVDCVSNNKEILVPGEMGLRDMKILMAVYKAADTDDSVALDLDNLGIPTYDTHVEVNSRLKTAMG